MAMVPRFFPQGERSTDDSSNPVLTVRVSGADSIALFRLMVYKATNCWDDAPAELKEFADLVMHGEILQDYQSQQHSTPRVSIEFYRGLKRG